MIIVPLAVAISASRPLVGINYFNGWWHGPGDKWYEPWAPSINWRPIYPERIPLIGDGYNSMYTMNNEIDVASAHGVDFFQILWYNDRPTERAPGAHFLNDGVKNFMNSPNAHKMSFFIEFCNSLPLFGVHNDSEWEDIITEDWLPAFGHPSYLKVDGRLVFKVHSGPDWKTNCSSDAVVTQRLDRLRAVVQAAGLGELIIGAGSSYDDISDPTQWWGYDYDWKGAYAGVANDSAAFAGKVLPWSTESGYVRQWRAKQANFAANQGNSKYSFLPMVMSGWDPRPWREHRASYVFPTYQEWTADLQAVRDDLKLLPRVGFPLRNGSVQPAFHIYAWNEYAEGGVMAPSHGWNFSRLEGVQAVFPVAE
jgi:hypothetical protein